MKFIKVITKHTPQDIKDINSKLDAHYTEMLLDLYDTFNYIRFCTEDGFLAMYAVLEETKIAQLHSEWIKWSINFVCEDITKFVLFGNVPEIYGTEEKRILNDIVREFIENNLDTDTVLDKINEMGFHNLTDKDKKVLNEN